MAARTSKAVAVKGLTVVKSGEDEKDVFVTSKGLKVRVSPVDPMFMQAVVNSVSIPKTPVYEVKTVTGRTEVHRLDEKAAAQMPDGLSIWEAFLEERSAALALQNERVMKAMFLVGAETEVPDNGWDKKWQMLGVEVPTDPEERKIFYLRSELSGEDVTGLMSAIMRAGGVDEEMIRQAEDAFRDTVLEGE